MSDHADKIAEGATDLAMKAIFDLKAMDDDMTGGQAASLIAIAALAVLASFEGRPKAAETAYRFADGLVTGVAR